MKASLAHGAFITLPLAALFLRFTQSHIGIWVTGLSLTVWTSFGWNMVDLPSWLTTQHGLSSFGQVDWVALRQLYPCITWKKKKKSCIGLTIFRMVESKCTNKIWKRKYNLHEIYLILGKYMWFCFLTFQKKRKSYLYNFFCA